jgi:hypothetical protein
MDAACVSRTMTVRQHSISQVDGTPEQMFDSGSQGVGDASSRFSPQRTAGEVERTRGRTNMFLIVEMFDTQVE